MNYAQLFILLPDLHQLHRLFRHKTQHLKFIFGVPLIFFLQVALISYFFYKG